MLLDVIGQETRLTATLHIPRLRLIVALLYKLVTDADGSEYLDKGASLEREIVRQLFGQAIKKLCRASYLLRSDHSRQVSGIVRSDDSQLKP